MFLIIDEYQSRLNEKEIFENHGRTISYCNFVATLIDKENGKYKVLKERFGKYHIGDIINEGQVFDHCWYVMGKGRIT